jgi:hypothetical protein
MNANHTPENRDADLIRHLDGELAAGERLRIEAALATDAGLAERMAVLKHRSARLASLLGSIAPSAAETTAADPSRGPAADPDAGVTVVSIEAGRRTHRKAPVMMVQQGARRNGPSGATGAPHVQAAQPRWLRAAIIIVALSLGAVFVPPVRAWIVQQLRRFTPSAPVVTPSPPLVPQTEAEPGVLNLEFEVGPSAAFEITIERVQASGELVVRSSDVERASASRRGSENGEDLLVSSGGLRISNVTASTASYEVVMPSRVRRLIVRIGSRPPVTIELEPGTSQVMGLAADASTERPTTSSPS